MAGEAYGNRARRERVLDPVSRATEILFGLIMVLTFTASFNAADAAHADVRLLLIAALGCNIAWGLIDAAMYLISTQSEKALATRTIHNIRIAASAELGRGAVRAALPPVVAAALSDDDIEKVRIHISDVLEPAVGRLVWNDYVAAAAVFLAVFVATLPVVLPFMLLSDPVLALRTSHTIAIALLFVVGWALGRNWGKPLRVGLAMVAIGMLLVTVAMALGG